MTTLWYSLLWQKPAVETSESREINFNKGWKFHFGDVTGAETKDYDDSKADEWGDLNLPHDFSIAQKPSNSNEAESGFMPGWYRMVPQELYPAECYAGKSVVLTLTDLIIIHMYM